MRKIYLSSMLALGFCITTKVSHAQVITQTVSYTGSLQSFTVPAGCVNQLTITCYGGQGANGSISSYGAPGGVGGSGAMSSGVYTVSPGAVLNIYVGGAASNSLGGFNGGGNGANGNPGGGGGATDIRVGGTALANRIIVAGGGGGGGNGGCMTSTVNGGNGGAGGGGNGTGGSLSPSGGPGGGAVGTVGGSPGIGCNCCLGVQGGTGALGIGGNGGIGAGGCCCTATVGGGGGGGGFNGGGGGGGGSAGTVGCQNNDQGGGGGGAGGTNYFDAAFTNTQVTNGVNTGNGKVVISFVPSALSLTLSASNPTVCAGASSSLTVSGASTYTWSTGSNASNITVNPMITTTYTVTGTIPVPALVCSGTAAVIVTVTPIPSVSVTAPAFICTGQSAILTASGADSYSWSTGATTSSISVSPVSTSSYVVTGTNANGCSPAATAITVTVSVCTDIAGNTSTLKNLLLYPNPTNGEFVIELPNGLEKTVFINDVTGKQVLKQNGNSDKITVNMKHLPNGIYFINVRSGDANEVLKLVKE